VNKGPGGGINPEVKSIYAKGTGFRKESIISRRKKEFSSISQSKKQSPRTVKELSPTFTQSGVKKPPGGLPESR